MAVPKFKKPLLPIPRSLIERLPYAKEGSKRRMYYCPCCNRLMYSHDLKKWLYINSNVFSLYEFRKLVKKKYGSNIVSVMSCIRGCDVSIGLVYSNYSRKANNVIAKISTEELYDFIVEIEDSIPF